MIQAVERGIPNAAWGLRVIGARRCRMGGPGMTVDIRCRDRSSGVSEIFHAGSFLHRRTLSAERGIPNARTPFGMGRIPCGNRIRLMPEGVPPERFDGVFPAIVADPGRVRCAVGDAV